MQVHGAEDDSGKLSWEERVTRAREAVWEIVQKVWLYVLIGIGIGAGIHGYVPTDTMAVYMGKDAAWWAVPLVVLMAYRSIRMRLYGADTACARRKGGCARNSACIHDGRGRRQPAGNHPAAPRAESRS
jgi:hypothetical protein